MEFWGQKTFCLVTGASRGIGKCIAIEFAKKVGPGSVLLLIARTASTLEETKTEILSIPNSITKSIQVITEPLDLGTPDSTTYSNIIKSALTKSKSTAADFNHMILVHNAGSLGNIKLHVIEQGDAKTVQDYYNFNLISLIILTAQFFQIFNDKTKQRSMIQISSLGAIQPFKTWGLYCSGKAARDMLMRSIAEEEEGTISTFNYAPGPVETDIFTEAVTQTGDPELKEFFASSQKKGEILTCIQTVTKLVRILGEKKYTKGEHVDYFDIE